MPAADSATARHLWIALALSLSTHALLLAALGLSVGGTRPSFAPQPELWVRLVDTAHASSAVGDDQDTASLSIRTAVAEPLPASARLAAQAPAPGSKRAEPDAPPSRSSKVSVDKPPRLLNGHVEVATTSTLARLGEALAARSLSEFPPEVEKPVRPASVLAMDYPPAALEAQREGSVLAWVNVDVDGSVREVEIVEGEPGFADGVRDSLLKAHFLPAEAGGQAVPGYIILQFDFRIGSRTGPAHSDDLGLRPVT